MNSIFTFDHGQKKLNKAIGVEESYMDDLQEQIANLLKNHLFDENKEILVQRAAFGSKQSEGDAINDPIIIPLGKGIVGTVAKTGIPLRIK